MKKILILLIMFFSFTLSVHADFYGLSLFHGSQVSRNMGWDVSQELKLETTLVEVRYGTYFSKRWAVYFEGLFGKYDIENIETAESWDIYTAGLTGNIRFDFIQFDTWAAYAFVGGGFNYLSGTPDDFYIKDNSLPALFKYGIGIKKEIQENLYISASLEVIHNSALANADDCGLNFQSNFLTLGFEYNF